LVHYLVYQRPVFIITHLNFVQNLIQIYIELHGESNKDNANPSNACAISKYFATSFCTYVESLVKSLLSTSKTLTNPTLPVADVNCLDFGELFKSSRALDNTVASEMEYKKENLDTSVNSRITCEVITSGVCLLIIQNQLKVTLFRM